MCKACGGSGGVRCFACSGTGIMAPGPGDEPDASPRQARQVQMYEVSLVL